MLSGSVDIHTKIFTYCDYSHIFIHIHVSLTSSSLTIQSFPFQMPNQPAKTFATAPNSVCVPTSNHFYFQTRYTTEGLRMGEIPLSPVFDSQPCVGCNGINTHFVFHSRPGLTHS